MWKRVLLALQFGYLLGIYLLGRVYVEGKYAPLIYYLHKNIFHYFLQLHIWMYKINTCEANTFAYVFGLWTIFSEFQLK